MDSSSVPSSGPNWGLIAGGVFVVIVIVVVSLYFSGVFGSSPSSTPSTVSSTGPVSSPNVANLQAMFSKNPCKSWVNAYTVWLDSIGVKAVPANQKCSQGTSEVFVAGGTQPVAGFRTCSPQVPLPQTPDNVQQNLGKCWFPARPKSHM